MTVAKEFKAKDIAGETHELVSLEGINGIVKVKKVEKYGLAKITGEIICPCVYDEIEAIKNSFKIRINGLWGIMDINGKILCPCDYTNLIQIDDGGAYCERDDDVYYIRFVQ